VSALVAVILVVGLAAALLTYVAHQRGTASNGKWLPVLTGRTITALAAASSDSAILYACATTWRPDRPIANAPGDKAPPTLPSFTVLRSADAGATWGDVGAQANLTGACQLAINPANSDEVYVATVAEPKATNTIEALASVLRHTTDGGHTWTAIQPTLAITAQIPSLTSTPTWDVQALSMSGPRLFGLQAIPSTQALPASPAVPVPPFPLALLRLATSADGGRTWTMLDAPFHAADLSSRSYAVDPADPATIYLLVGHPLVPFAPADVSPTKPLPHTPPTPPTLPQPLVDNGDLYKTTDGGAHWRRVLQDISFGAAIHLAVHVPGLVYVGGSAGPVPLVSAAVGPANAAGSAGAQPTSSSLSPVVGDSSFQLRMSHNGGETWQPVAPLTLPTFLQDWFVGPDGTVYAYLGGFFASGVSISESGTAVPGHPGIPGTPGTPVAPPKGGTPGSSATSQQEATPAASTPIPQPTLATTPSSAADGAPVQGQGSVGGGAPAKGQNLVFAYDPSSNAWSQLLAPQTTGSLLAVTAAPNGTALWFLAEDQTQSALYRLLRGSAR
jgi:hypothetical protein